jgi:hypothetical protein
MASRLDALSPDLAVLLARADPRARQLAVLAACSQAVAASGGSSPEVGRGLELLEQASSGNDLERAALLRRLGVLQEELDEVYFELQAQEEGRVSQGSHLPKFRQARAVSAVVFGLRSDALEAVYEAAAAVPESAALIEAVRSALE